MENVKDKRCIHMGCTKLNPPFDFPGGKGTYCAVHKLAEMIDVKHKKCSYPYCLTRPNFDHPGGKGLYCVEHKLSGMEDITHKHCAQFGCFKRPRFDNPGGKGLYCAEHTLAGMKNVISNQCAYSECSKQPSFNYPGGRGLYCAEHKLAGMKCVRTKRCAHPGCLKLNPIFNHPGGKGLYCSEHKLAGMKDVKHKWCVHPGCSTRPNFDFPGGKGQYCAAHKLDKMKDVTTKRCAYPGCSKLNPSFDNLDGNGLYCADHKIAGMKDVKHKQCLHPDCTTRSWYGPPGYTPTHCAQHRAPGMIRRPNARCAVCKEPAIYGTNFTPRHCEAHREPEETNLVERPCVSCNLLYVLDTNGHCENCDPESFKVARLQKQTALMSALDYRKDIPTPASTDRTVDGGACGKERPDRIYDLGDKILVLECDEHQHMDRPCLCEQTRMVNIAQSFGGLPTYFLRWNPDDYSPLNARKRVEELSKRHALVGDYIRDIAEGRICLPSALCAAIYFYYDDWDGLSNTAWTTLTPLEGVIEHV